MESKIEVEGLGSLQKDLKGIADKLTKKDLARALKSGARTFERAVKNLAPKRTGLLRRAIRTKVGKGKNNAPYASVWVTFGKVNTSKIKGLSQKQQKGKAYYAIMVHNGTVVGVNGKRLRSKESERATTRTKGAQRIKPHPFVYDAFEANVQAVADKILNDIASQL